MYVNMCGSFLKYFLNVMYVIYFKNFDLNFPKVKIVNKYLFFFFRNHFILSCLSIIYTVFFNCSFSLFCSIEIERQENIQEIDNKMPQVFTKTTCTMIMFLCSHCKN